VKIRGIMINFGNRVSIENLMKMKVIKKMKLIL